MVPVLFVLPPLFVRRSIVGVFVVEKFLLLFTVFFLRYFSETELFEVLLEGAMKGLIRSKFETRRLRTHHHFRLTFAQKTAFGRLIMTHDCCSHSYCSCCDSTKRNFDNSDWYDVAMRLC